ncbi:MAG: HD domain-containing protein [Eudoraea sp.]|nr:HD domain-containing protein [Eudoraea sp.]
MKKSNKLKVFSDPIYGFIRIPNAQLFNLIAHPYFQRLRRISQMGLSYLVYPGAHHTRFHHALGSMYLMQQAIQVLRVKKNEITEEEALALSTAILLHDIGHGPFSHAMEHSIVEGISHEEISLAFMEALNEEFEGDLNMAIDIFKGTYPKKFLNQLVSSQLDMDRLDYLKRDSFFTGVFEGNINAERLISMLNVYNDSLVIEEKGIYSVEKFLMARRFMYWQVYLHKTGLVAEQLLIRILQRAKQLHRRGETIEASTALSFFIDKQIDAATFDANALKTFANLDDIDILSAIKHWRHHSDLVLSKLCQMVLDRKLLKIRLQNDDFAEEEYQQELEKVTSYYNCTEEEAGYFVFKGTIANTAYDLQDQKIHILKKDGQIADVTDTSDHFNLKALARTVTKHYLCYPLLEE